MDVYVDGVLQDTPDSNRTFSSVWDNETISNSTGHATSRLSSTRSWSAETRTDKSWFNLPHWIKLDLGSIKNITGIKVIPRADSPYNNQYITGFSLEFSNNNNTWYTTSGSLSSRFYKGWRLDYVFDYTLGNSGDVRKPSSDITVYAKWKEDDDWYSRNQREKNLNWEWNFGEDTGNIYSHTQTMAGDIGYKNIGFLIHGTDTSDQAGQIYSGQDENSTGIYNAYRDWSKVRVYVKRSGYALPKSIHCYNDMKKISYILYIFLVMAIMIN